MTPEMKQIIASQANSGAHPASIKIGDSRYYKVGREGSTSVYADPSTNGKNSTSFVMTNNGKVMTFQEYAIAQCAMPCHTM